MRKTITTTDISCDLCKKKIEDIIFEPGGISFRPYQRKVEYNSPKLFSCGDLCNDCSQTIMDVFCYLEEEAEKV